VHLYREL